MNKQEIKKIVNVYAEMEWERIQNIEFPYPIIMKEHCDAEWEALCSKRVDINASSPLINRSHESLYSDKKKGEKSSIDCWEKLQNDFSLFKKLYKSLLLTNSWAKDIENKKYINIGFMPDFVYLKGIGFQNYIRPMFAKYLIKKYLDKYSEIFDPFSEYGGIALATLACNKNYIGQDKNRKHIVESRYMMEYLRKYIKISNYCHLKVKDSLKTEGEYDCLLTKVPMSDEKFITKCLENYKCKKYVFIVSEKIKKYKRYIKEKTKYGYVVVINKR